MTTYGLYGETLHIYIYYVYMILLPIRCPLRGQDVVPMPGDLLTVPCLSKDRLLPMAAEVSYARDYPQKIRVTVTIPCC